MAQRPYRTGVSFRMGLVSVHADLFPVKASGTSGSLYSNVCPSCDEAVRCTQQMVCPVGHGPFTQGQLAKARAIDKDTLVRLTDDDLTTIKGSFPTQVMELMVCPAEDFKGKTLPGGTAYRMKPGKTDNDGYQLLKALVSEGSHAFYGRLKMDESATPSAFHLSVWQGQLLLQSIVPPSSLAPVDVIEGDAEPKYLAMAQELVSKMEAPFDGAALADERIERINTILAAKAAGAPVPVAVPVTQTDDLMAMLQASLESRFQRMNDRKET